jgi:hypothetical protein
MELAVCPWPNINGCILRIVTAAEEASLNFFILVPVNDVTQKKACA